MVYLVVVAVGYSSVAEINKRRPEPEFLISIIPIATFSSCPYFKNETVRQCSNEIYHVLFFQPYSLLEI